MIQHLKSSISNLSFLVLTLSSCYYEDIPRLPYCTDSDLAISATSQNASGCGQANGSIEAMAINGVGSYLYSKDGGLTKQVSGSFMNLTGGIYTITVFDDSQCSTSTSITVNVTGSDFNASILSVTPDTDCLSDNGSVQLQAVGGKSPFTFKLGTTSNSAGTFNNLAPGAYTVIANDAVSCSVSVSVIIPSQSSVSYLNNIAPILTERCNTNTCHGTKGPQIDFTKYENVKNNAADIKTRIMNGSMPKQPKPGGDLTDNELKLIVCWIDNGALNN